MKDYFANLSFSTGARWAAGAHPEKASNTAPLSNQTPCPPPEMERGQGGQHLTLVPTCPPSEIISGQQCETLKPAENKDLSAPAHRAHHAHHVLEGNVSIWYERYEERTAIMQFDGGMNKAQAEAAAYEDILQQWIHDHPPQPLQYENCFQCGEALPIDSYTAYGDTVLCNQRLVPACYNNYVQSRSIEAAKALAADGVHNPKIAAVS